ncbi:transglycosylase/D,D-transpeptidase PonA2 [Mycobacterium sp.]|uniref:transglycosylase/D,D-transpeptidase PonA2 n=1 Tax=Mycobacterium sp. TaxID=1785 RepID=UPI003A8B6195
MPVHPTVGQTLLKLGGYCLLAGVLAAALMFPVAGGIGLMSNRASEIVANGSAQLLEGQVPAVSTVVDAKGNVIAWLYSQRRFEVPSDKIADTMKLAIVSIEDKRFADHNGVDWKGTLTGLAGYASGDLDTRGGSTIEQQYIKNFQLLVSAKTDEEKRAAVEPTPARKLREIRMALTLDKSFSKPEILTRYLNLVSFGNNSFGVQDAAQTYFGVNAIDLNWQQAALLAGMVQSTSALNPYTNPKGALARRNLVLDTMIENLPGQAEALQAAKTKPLGILPQPNELPRGCIAAGDRAFFCDYVQEYLARAGLRKEEVATGGYQILTTLDPDVQNPVKAAVDQFASPTLTGISSVMSVILPGQTSHKVVAMASNRTYGLDLAAGQTMRPQPFSLVGDGAGSIFKIFTTAAALEMGMGINAQLTVPPRFEAKGLGSGGAKGCPKDTWCVVNAGGYVGSMNVTDALATSPNTAFAKLISQIGVSRAVDMAVKLGLRSYATPGTARDYNPESNESLADFVKRQNLGSFTLGPIKINALELSNVAATLASGGVWCPPNPIDKLIDRNGNEVAVTTATCEQVVPQGLADTLANAMSKDAVGMGTAAGSAGGAGWFLPMSGKTGTTETHRSSGFVGFTNRYAAANYIYDDSPTPMDLCSWPLRRCGNGNLYGGSEPARTWFTAFMPIADHFGEVHLPPTDPRYVDGSPAGAVPNIAGLNVEQARQRLREAGFEVAEQPSPINSIARFGEVVGSSPTGQTIPGSIITILTSNGIAPPPPPPPPPPQWNPPPQQWGTPPPEEGPPPPPPPPEVVGSQVIEIPGLPPITIPLLEQPPP